MLERVIEIEVKQYSGEKRAWKDNVGSCYSAFAEYDQGNCEVKSHIYAW